ncbi:MAG: Ig-like domain-containing protein [Ruminococcus sp.]|nr:Ig-like domain-containing protein [Ruminococcus sp.]
MCTTAHQYGVKVIVDVVANHTTPSKSSVASELKNLAGGLYHTSSSSSDNRYNMTQRDLQGLPDCNTHNKNYQNVILNYLKKCVSDGADGFRFDAAKHIELPSDNSSYASDFWPTVLDNGSTFQYGEVLQSTDDHYTDYSKLMHVTASTLGGTVRTYFRENCNNISATSFIANNSGGVKSDRLVTWVESHDTYANEEEVQYPSLSSFWLSNDEIRRGWALIGARKGASSLFFNRPADSQETTDEDLDGNVRWGNNKIGDAGDDNWNHPEVVAINKFRNAMWGESEKLENINSNKQIIMITRGTRGAVIINNSDDEVVLNNQSTNLADGSYTDKVNGVSFTASGGKLSGTVGAKKFAVIYDESIKPTYPTEAPTTAPPATEVTLKAAKSAIKVGDTTALIVTVTNASGDTTYSSSNSAVAKITSATANGCAVKGLKAGKAAITAVNNGVSTQVSITVSKKANPMTVKTKTITARAKKKTSFTKAKAFTISKAQGAVNFKKASGDKRITVSKTGKITVKSGLKKGKTYNFKVKVTAAGNVQYNPLTKTVIVKVKVK